MAGGFVNPGFTGRRRPEAERARRLPPGQHEESGFPVLTVGPTPWVDLATWELRVDGLVEEPLRLDWEAFRALPRSEFRGDIHCVTTWSKLGTAFAGVSLDELLARARPLASATHVAIWSFGGYTTNLPLADLRQGRAWIADEHEGAPLERDHGGPARLLVPHLYFWKSAKWIAGLRLLNHDEPGFWEQNGYHAYGDPWREQRYDGD